MKLTVPFLAVLLLAVGPAFGTSFGMPNEVTNGGFDDGLNGWTVSGGGTWGEGVPAPSAAIHSHWGGAATMTLEQQWLNPYPTVPVQDIDVSFDWKLYDLGSQTSSILVELTVNGGVIWSWSTTNALDTWVHEEHIIPGVTLGPTDYKDIHITLVAGGTNITGAAIDNVDVEQTPEPGTLALFGLSGLALFRRRR